MDVINTLSLENATQETEFFTLTGDYKAKIVDVYDGDTVKAVIDLPGFGCKQFKVRLYGIDTPELRVSKEDPNRDEIKQKARISRDVLEEKVLDNIVVLKCYGFGKYGRLLAEIYLGEENINEWMLANGYGEEYLL